MRDRNRTAHIPSAAVREFLAVFYHEVDVMQGAGHERLARLRLILLRGPVDLGHLGAVGEWLSVPGNTNLVGFDHRRVAQNRCELISVMTDGDRLPILVSPKFGEGEAAWHL
jgi:hypothetical protein